MAEINIQRNSRPIWPWVILVLIFLVAIMIWYWISSGDPTHTPVSPTSYKQALDTVSSASNRVLSGNCFTQYIS